MQSKATTVEQYLGELPEDRRAAIAVVRHVILKNLDKDYEEGMQYGMIGYYVPHRIYPAGYHTDPKQPLPYVCLASQKEHMSLYMMPVYGEGVDEKWFRDEWAKTGKKLDMGKSCIRFRHLEDLALNVIGEAIRRSPVKAHIEYYESVIKHSRTKSAKQAPAKPAEKQPSKAASNAKTKSKSAKPAPTKPATRKAAAAKSIAGKSAKTSKPVAAKQPAKKSTTKSTTKIVKKVAKVVKKAVKKKATKR